ncbi:MAG: TetR/AcrR family transcriptional regulator [Erysipelotrichaceae bacterium]
MSKKQQIINGLIALAQSQKDVKLISVQAIADAAGVKKASVYDYFQSKEEVFSATIIYLCTQQLNDITAKLTNENFQANVNCILDSIYDNVVNQLSTFNFFYRQERNNDEEDFWKNPEFIKLSLEVETLVESIVALGVKEGKISAPSSNQYLHILVKALIHSANLYAYQAHFDNQLDYQIVKQDIYEILVKSLA